VGWRPLRLMGVKIGAEVRKVDRQVVLPNGGMVGVRSADDPNSLRGEGLDFVVLDECAFMAEAAWTEALRPALSDRQGKALFISTPKGRNWFWRLYQRGLDDGREWMAFRFPTSTNPYIAQKEIDDAQAMLPEAIFEQEYLAEFLEGEGAVFRNIAACLYGGGEKPEDHAGHKIVAGVDWGKQADFTAISVGCATCHKELALDRFNQIDYHFQRGRLEAICSKWNVGLIMAESNAMGEPIIEELQRSGLSVTGFQTTATSKPPLIESMALAFEREEWHWLDDPISKGELEAYERVISMTTGRSSYGAPEGLHDDTVIARALMLEASGGHLWWII
jgi:hypothetical protein